MAQGFHRLVVHVVGRADTDHIDMPKVARLAVPLGLVGAATLEQQLWRRGAADENDCNRERDPPHFLATVTLYQSRSGPSPLPLYLSAAVCAFAVR